MINFFDKFFPSKLTMIEHDKPLYRHLEEGAESTPVSRCMSIVACLE